MSMPAAPDAIATIEELLAGVAEYWIVDLDAKLIERWTPEDERPAVHDGELTWDPPDGASVTLSVPTLVDG